MILDDLSQRDDRLGVLIICEHPPVVSIGRDGSIADLVAEPEDLVARQLDIRHVARSGGVILHGPGQLSGYLMLPWIVWTFPVCFRSACAGSVLQRVAVNCVCRQDLVIPLPGVSAAAARSPGAGQWVDSGLIAWPCVLNVNPDVVGQRLVQPAPAGETVASMSMQRMQMVPMPKVREALVRHLSHRVRLRRFPCLHSPPAADTHDKTGLRLRSTVRTKSQPFRTCLTPKPHRRWHTENAIACGFGR